MKEKLLHFFKPPFLQRLAYHFCNTLMLTNQAQYVISSNWITGEFLLCLNEIYLPGCNEVTHHITTVVALQLS